MTEKINNSTDLEHFNKYKVEDLTVDKTKYEFSTFKKKRLVPFTFFSKKQFKNYIKKQDNNTKLSIVPDESVLLKQQGKENITATITQEKQEFTYSDLKDGATSTSTGNVIANSLSAGSWNGSFNFTVSLKNK